MPQYLAPTPANRGQKRKQNDIDSNTSAKKRRDDNSMGSVSSSNEEFWRVQWRAPQTKKNKTWDGDGVLARNGFACKLFDQDGRPLSSGTVKGSEAFVNGLNLTIGGKDVELDFEISRQDYLSGRCYGSGFETTPAPQTPAYPSSAGLKKPFVPLKGSSDLNFKVPARAPKVLLYPVPLMSTGSSATQDSGPESKTDHGSESYWAASWRKPQQKKHKTWDSDGFVTHIGGKLSLISDSGKILGTKKAGDINLEAGFETIIGSREISLNHSVYKSDIPAVSGVDIDDQDLIDPEVLPISPPRRRVSLTAKESDISTPASTSKPFVAPVSFYGKAPEKVRKGPLHDPDAEGAIVLTSPSKDHETKFNKRNLEIVPVVIDPVLAMNLRPHQIEGVKFLYECVMGLRKHRGEGCILADEMGLGKTLQTITLVWTLLKQNPYAGVGPVIGKALIVCPVSLVNNWKAEFYKWLGRDRVSILVGDKDKALVKQFINSRQQVLIIGYEKLRTVIAVILPVAPPIGLIICDEGHRLKSANNKTSAMFEALRTTRRVILSGTPIQNDLGEFHAMVDFCNPGLLDDYSAFRRNYETPILKSRMPDRTESEKELGEARNKELNRLAKSFVLRREASIIKGLLPPKHEYVVFITPTKVQLDILLKILNKDQLDSVISRGLSDSLVLIGILQKICNSPILLKATADKNKSKENQGGEVTKNAIHEALEYLPRKVQVEDVSLSGKLTALASLLRTIRKHTDEKVVIVSHWTSTLNIIEAFCKKKNYSYYRLDGSTPGAKRQEYVNDFNKSGQSTRFIFLLSSKAGGVGINLIGASRLCLIDCDWNPSHDLQSMARIHRDGQKRPVFIYRFLTAGTIDEKIFQRQVTKLGLSASVMGTGNTESTSDSFTPKELRDIFTIHPHTGCHTHDLLDCPCEGHNKPIISDKSDASDEFDESDEEAAPKEKGFRAASQINAAEFEKMDRTYLLRKKAQLASLGEWTHINALERSAREHVKDEILASLLHKFTLLEDEEVSEKKAEPTKSRIQSLLDVDVQKLSAMEIDSDLEEEKKRGLSVHDVPGGTISFLFERLSTTTDVVEEG